MTYLENFPDAGIPRRKPEMSSISLGAKQTLFLSTPFGRNTTYSMKTDILQKSRILDINHIISPG